MFNLQNKLFAPFQSLLLLVGRILIAAFFIPAGIGKLGSGFSGTVAYAASAGLPMPAIGVALAIALEIGVGLALLLGVMTRFSALALAVFTAVAATIFHGYWAMPAEMQGMQSIIFWNHIALVGGLLGFAAFGAGRWSVDGLMTLWRISSGTSLQEKVLAYD